MMGSTAIDGLVSKATQHFTASKFKLREFEFDSENSTQEIYFTNSMKGLVGEIGDERFPIWKISASVFYVHGERPKIVVLRGWSRFAAKRVSELPAARIHYLIDDDVVSGVGDRNLNVAYRQRLSIFRQGVMKELLERADCVYVPSKILADRLDLSAKTIKFVKPALIHPVSDLLHHSETGRLRVIFPGTRSHLAGLKEIASQLRKVMEEMPELHLTTYLGRHAPKELLVRNAVHHETLPWVEYRDSVLKLQRYHLALLPCRSSRFNEARSESKILDCAMLGAAPLASASLPYASILSEAGAGKVYYGGAKSWIGAFNEIRHNRKVLAEIALANGALARHLGNTEVLRDFWLDALEL